VRPDVANARHGPGLPAPAARISRRFLVFACCGAVGTLGHYLTMIALVQALRVGPVAASVAGFLVGMGVNYVLNYRFTFRSRKRHREAATKFFLVAACGLALNTALMHTLTGPAALHYVVAQVGTTAVVLLWNFAANQVWTFAHEGNR
jgi:putative flippase GtrA